MVSGTFPRLREIQLNGFEEAFSKQGPWKFDEANRYGSSDYPNTWIRQLSIKGKRVLQFWNEINLANECEEKPIVSGLTRKLSRV